MGAGASLISNPRYIGGKTYWKFFHEDVWPVMEEIFERLRVTEDQGYQVFRVFAAIDSNEDGMISNAEIFKYLKIVPNKFTERLFFIETHDQVNNIIVHQHLQPTTENEDLLSYTALHNQKQLRKELFFQEFFLRLWNFNTLSISQLAQYIFEIFDVELEYTLHKAYLSTIYLMLYHTTLDDREYYQDYDSIIDETTQLFTKDHFITQSTKLTTLIQPVIFFQKKLQTMFGSTIMWYGLKGLRYQYFSTYDENASSLDESFLTIIQSSYAVSTKAKKSRRHSDHLLQEKLQHIRTVEAKIEQEITSNVRYNESMKVYSNTNDETYYDMIAAREELVTYQSQLLQEEFLCTKEDMERRAIERNELYALYDTYKTKALIFYEFSNTRELQISEGIELDHAKRYEDYLVTEEGEILYELTFYITLYERILQYYQDQLVEQEQKQKHNKNSILGIKEKMFIINTNLKSLQQYQVPFLYINYIPFTQEKRLQMIKRYKNITARNYEEDKKICKELLQAIPNNKLLFTETQYLQHEYYRYALLTTKDFLYSELKSFTLQFCQEHIELITKEREQELRKLEKSIINAFGSRITQWEYVLNKDTNQYLYIHRQTFQQKHIKTAICEHCDAIIVQHELRCDECLAPRSDFNMKLYRPLGFGPID